MDGKSLRVNYNSQLCLYADVLFPTFTIA